eukprot:6492699-Amphidinium_carterae.1
MFCEIVPLRLVLGVNVRKNVSTPSSMTNFLSCVNWYLVGPFFVVGIAKHSPVVDSTPVKIWCVGCPFALTQIGHHDL